MKIAIDVDDVLADFSGAFIEFQKKEYNLDLEPIKKLLYGSEWMNSVNLSKEEGIRRIMEFVESDRTKNLQTVKGSQSAIEKLGKKFKLVALTGRPASVAEVTKKWLEENFSNSFSDFLITDAHIFHEGKKDKGEMCIENGIKLLIDDLPQYCMECASVDVHSFLFSQPHNQYFDEHEYSEITRMNSWEDVIKKLI